ncbi:hypothetical protein AAE478_005629 [Parahypoxylon ruwenzoriense]
MLTTAPYLRTRRPSPTTAEFIVSTLPPLTAPLRIALGAIYLVRLVLALGVLLLLYSAWAQSPYATATTTTTTPISSLAPELPLPLTPSPLDTTTLSPLPPLAPADASLFSRAGVQHALHAILSSRLGHLCALISSSLPPWVLLPSSLLALYALSLRIGTEERLLVLRGLGIQTSSSGRSLLSTPAARTRFIPTDKIVDVLLSEAFRGFEVRHYLAVVVDGEDDLVVVFPELLPRPRVLEKVWRGVRGCLYEREGGERGGVAGFGFRTDLRPKLTTVVGR